MSDFVRIPASKSSIVRRKPIFGVGINDSDYVTRIVLDNGKSVFCPYYSRWKSMIMRCYSKSYLDKNPSYNGCTVSDEWMTFSKFSEWMSGQEWKGKCLDKDIIIPFNKHYTKDRRIFVPYEVNGLLSSAKATRGELPIGVVFNHRVGKYQAQCHIGNKNIFIGYYGDPYSASRAYRIFKHDRIMDVANRHNSLRRYLKKHAELYLNGEIE